VPAVSAPPAVPIVIYLIDTLRADRLHLYGHPQATSPTLDALAAESVVFEQTYTAAPWTLPSVASLVTSTFVCEHGLVEPSLKLDPSIRTLAERLKSIGFATGAYYGNAMVGSPSELDRGYDVSELFREDDIREDEARAFLDRVGNAPPFLLYLHTMEPHQPYLVPYQYLQPFGHVPIEQKAKIDDYWTEYGRLKRLDVAAGRPPGASDETAALDRIAAGLTELRPVYERLYDASVLQADDNLRNVIEVLKSRGLWERTLFIVLGDHGDEFGEHGGWFHEDSVYEPVMRVPLIIHFPEAAFAGRRVPDAVSLVDVAPTILDYLGRPELCDGCRGRSLMPLLNDAARPSEDAYVPGLRMNATAYYRRIREQRGDINVAVRQGRWKAIWNEAPATVELYDLETDPQEQRDLSRTDASQAEQLRSHAARWLGECRSTLKAPAATQLDERTREQLKALGYAH
jgi:arylsulfatase A-like enzyme